MQNELNPSTNLIENLFDQIPGIIFLKDIHSKFLMCNTFTAKLLGYTNADQMIGMSDYDHRCAASDFAPKFIQEDRSILQSQNSGSFINVLKFSDSNIHYLISNKKPFINTYSKKAEGIICQSTVVTDPFLIDAIKRLISMDQQLMGLNSSLLGTYQIGHSSSNKTLLTKMQSLCLFYLLRGKTIKEIALLLNRSARTVETHVENLKTIFDCANKSSLISKAIESGFLYQIPPEILPKLNYTL